MTRRVFTLLSVLLLTLALLACGVRCRHSYGQITCGQCGSQCEKPQKSAPVAP